jgi:type I restriction enzyme M protein
MIQKVGWTVGDKRAKPLYRRDPNDGSFLVSDQGELLLDTDFWEILADIRSSPATNHFSWLSHKEYSNDGTGWAVPISAVLSEPTLCLDAKRHCRKISVLRENLSNKAHFLLGQIVDFLPERRTSEGKEIGSVSSTLYRYVQIEDIAIGDFRWAELRGWELPDRAKHFAEPGDIFIGAIWGSVGKWFLAPGEASNLVVTNGCHRLRLKKGAEECLIDLAAALCTESYATQMRAIARGSDGLAEVSKEDAANVLIPQVQDPEIRRDLKAFLSLLLEGRTRLDVTVGHLIENGKLPFPVPPKRPSHVVLV